MITRQRIVTFGVGTIAAATIAFAAGLTPWTHSTSIPTPPIPTPLAEPIETVATSGHQIDLVFAVDTTGSMGGLIDGAKRTVWSIAKHIQKADPNANLRIGLVAYRDVGDDYVTRDFALTADLDAVFAELSAYEAAGGGDLPEDVDAALDDSLHKMKWRAGAKKLVFVVGDAPPASRGEVPTFDVLAREAKRKGIVINAIRAGQDKDTQVAFTQIAELSGGAYSSIQQDGGVQQIATPYDDRMAALSAKVDATSIIIGDATARRGYEAKMKAAEAAPMAAKADRAAYYAVKGGDGGRGAAGADLVTGGMPLDTIAPNALPVELQGKDKAEIEAEVEKRATARAELQQEIGALAKQRDAYLDGEAKKVGTADGFDTKVKEAIEAQLK